MLSDALGEFGKIERLAQKLRRPGFKSLGLTQNLPRNHNDGEFGVLRANLSNELDAIPIGHPQVGHDHVCRVIDMTGQCSASTARCAGPHFSGFEKLRNLVGSQRLVVHNENMQGRPGHEAASEDGDISSSFAAASLGNSIRNTAPSPTFETVRLPFIPPTIP